MRQGWTDDRLDDLSHRMDARFDRVEGEIKSQGTELRAEIKGQGEELRGEMQALQRTIIQIGWTGAITLIAAVAGVLIAQAL